MTGLDIEAIRTRAHIAAGAAAVAHGRIPRLALEAIRATCDAVPVVLAAVDELRDELVACREAHADALRELAALRAEIGVAPREEP